jgi:hypothetical protein
MVVLAVVVAGTVIVVQAGITSGEGVTMHEQALLS